MSAQMHFLRDLTLTAIEAARMPAGSLFTGRVPSQPGFVTLRSELPFDVIRPGGRNCYPALWIQDFTMTYSSGLIEPALGEQHLNLIAQTQNGPEVRPLGGGATIPAWAIPDHINLDGSPVFFPGTYSAGDDQGGEPYGLQPPANNYFDFIWLAWLRWNEESRSRDYLCQHYSGVLLMDRLRSAFDAVEIDPDCGLVYTVPERRFVGFIFCDSVYMTGHLLMASLLRYRAALHLADMMRVLGDDAVVAGYHAEACRIAAAISERFAVPESHGGWLLASTGISGQADVWGTLYALCLGILSEDVHERAIQQVIHDLDAGTIEYEGAFRHVPTDRDAGPNTSWERALTPHNTYQNGAFWHTPTGWAVHVLRKIAPATAEAVLERYLHSLMTDDFRRGPQYCAPWENIGCKPESFQNPVFLPSISLPLAVLTVPHRAGLVHQREAITRNK